MEADSIVETSGIPITRHFAEPNDEGLRKMMIQLRLSIQTLSLTKAGFADDVTGLIALAASSYD
ncbi:hypothetical protein BBP40_011866 [Aspergillus hancockii]|nr:hypothetical protein BBP40_011866 [Aspergillus hancockii]